MQTVWSRIAQVRGSCRCPHCLSTSSTNAVSRRTAASATRRMPRYLTSSTLCYSAIFAAAATFDARVKAQRRQKWDLAIAEVKHELGQPLDITNPVSEVVNESQKENDQTNISLSKYGDALGELEVELVSFSEQQAEGHITLSEKNRVFDEQKENLHNTSQLESKCNITAYDGDEALRERDKKLDDTSKAKSRGRITVFDGDEAFSELDANLISSRRRKKRAVWPVNTGPGLKSYQLPPQSIYSNDYRKEKAESTRWDKRKMEVLQLSVDWLQLNMFYGLHLAGWSEEAAAAVPSTYAEKILTRPEQLLSALAQKSTDLNRYYERGSFLQVFERSKDDVRLCNYQQDDLGHYHDTVHDLNRSLQHIFNRGENKELSVPAILAKTHYNLFSSPAPPNVDTYNTLIVGLSRIRQRERVNDVIASFRQTNMRPNEVSLASILNFYTDSGDVKLFQYWVNLMRGQYGGLMRARPGVEIRGSAKNRLIADPEKPSRIVQLPYPTPMVFGALIKGVLRFSGFDVALGICERMAHEGWGLSISGLLPLLQDCALRRDWTSGLAIWKQIQALKKKSLKHEQSRSRSEIIGLPTFIAMLRLCTHCNEKSAFHEIMDQAVRTHRRAVKQILQLVVAEGKGRASEPLDGSEHDGEDDATKEFTFHSAHGLPRGKIKRKDVRLHGA